MTTASRQPAPPPISRRRRAPIIVAVVVVLAIGVLLAIAAVWIVFFSAPAPPAPALDDALRVLLPSASPGA